MHMLWIDDADTLAREAEHWRAAQVLAVDTEFVRVETYYPRLCLVQVHAAGRTSLIDTLAFADLGPLFDALEAPTHIKLLHSPSQDLEIFVRLRGRCPQPLFDSQIAATLLGLGDQIGYAGLIEQRLGILLDKSLSRTDWSQRPLNDAQRAYAAADVIHLAEVFPALEAELAARDRLAWLAEDCARQCEVEQYVTLPEDAWRALKGLARMSAREQTVAAGLAAWREHEAQTRDRPRKWILADDVLYRIAQRQPAQLAQLEALDLPPATLRRHGGALLQLVEQAMASPAQTLALDDEPDAAQKALLKRLQDRVREQAERLNLPPGFLAPRAELMRIVREGTQADVRALRGWRGEQIGDVLRAVLASDD